MRRNDDLDANIIDRHIYIYIPVYMYLEKRATFDDIARSKCLHLSSSVTTIYNARCVPSAVKLA